MTWIFLLAAYEVGTSAGSADKADKPWLYAITCALIVGAALIYAFRHDE